MKTTIYHIAIFICLMMTACSPSDKYEINTDANYQTEFTLDGKTYNIGTTRWTNSINEIFTDEGSEGNLLMSLPNDLKIGTYTYSDGYFFIGYKDMPTFVAVYDSVRITVNKIGSVTDYGSANLEATFIGTFSYYDTDGNGIATGPEHFVILTGKISTKP